MRELLGDIQRWSSDGLAVAIATVVSVHRSAPRPLGAKLAVAANGELSGAVSGGCVEGAVVEAAEQVLAGGPPRLLQFGIADEDAWEIALPCGGEIEVWVERHRSGELDARVLAGERVLAVTLLDGPEAGAKLLVGADGTAAGGFADRALAAEVERTASELIWGTHSVRRGAVFYDLIAPPPRLVIFGAVDVATQLCRLARELGWRPYVADPRARFMGATRFPMAEEIIVAWPEQACAQLGGFDPATAVVVLTHDPKLDDPALCSALRSRAGFVGVMGSRNAQRDLRARLLAAGVTKAELSRLSGPVGLDLGALSPAETAVSILAEIIASGHGRAGGRLSAARGRIHQVPA